MFKKLIFWAVLIAAGYYLFQSSEPFLRHVNPWVWYASAFPLAMLSAILFALYSKNSEVERKESATYKADLGKDAFAAAVCVTASVGIIWALAAFVPQYIYTVLITLFALVAIVATERKGKKANCGRWVGAELFDKLRRKPRPQTTQGRQPPAPQAQPARPQAPPVSAPQAQPVAPAQAPPQPAPQQTAPAQPATQQSPPQVPHRHSMFDDD